MKRRPMSKKQSKKKFRAGTRVNDRNERPVVMRGGYSL